MNWFYKLKNKYRIIIAIASWLPLIIFSAVISGQGEQKAWQSIIILLLLALCIVFTIYAVRAYKKEHPKKIKPTEPQNPRPIGRNFIIKNADGSLDIKYGNGTIRHYSADEAKEIEVISENDDVLNADFDVKNDDNTDSVQTNLMNMLNLPLFTKIVGVTFNDRQKHIQNSKIGDELIIKHCPIEKYPEATLVYNKRTGDELGSINKDLAISLLQNFGNNFVLLGEIADITGGNDKNFGCNIQITTEG